MLFAFVTSLADLLLDADHMTTLNPSPPATLPVLYADEYGTEPQIQIIPIILTSLTGFHTGIHLWRGYFTGAATGVFLNVQGGTAL